MGGDTDADCGGAGDFHGIRVGAGGAEVGSKLMQDRKRELIFYGLGFGSAAWIGAFGLTLDPALATIAAACALPATPRLLSLIDMCAGQKSKRYDSVAEVKEVQSLQKTQTRRTMTTTPLMPTRERYDRYDPKLAPERKRRESVDRSLVQQLRTEIDAINTTLRALKIDAGTKPNLTVIGGDQMVFYRIKNGKGQKISDIESCLPELSDAISNIRRKQTLVRMLRFPLRLEVEHPFYKPLWWSTEALDGAANEVLIGKSYDDGPSNLRLRFSDAPHMLVAGTTGAGKSVLINAMVLSLAWNTAPSDLVIYLVDLKNKSLAPLRSLPHVKVFASSVEDASKVVTMASDALDAKIQNRRTVDHRQHLLVIDEYADLSGDNVAMEKINHIVRMGREDAVNMIIGTQHPTSSVLGKDGTKQNFPVRIVGSVTDANAANVALGMKGSNAHLLPPNRGAFLLRKGPELHRVNTYLLTRDDVAATVTDIRRKWGSTQHTSTTQEISHFSAATRVVEPVVEAVVEGSVEVDEIAEMVDAMRPHYNENISKNELCKRAFGKPFAGTSFCAKVNDALDRLTSDHQPTPTDDKIIKLRRSA